MCNNGLSFLTFRVTIIDWFKVIDIDLFFEMCMLIYAESCETWVL